MKIERITVRHIVEMVKQKNIVLRVVMESAKNLKIVHHRHAVLKVETCLLEDVRQIVDRSIVEKIVSKL